MEAILTQKCCLDRTFSFSFETKGFPQISSTCLTRLISHFLKVGYTPVSKTVSNSHLSRDTGCLIVEIHDHRSSDESKSSALPSAQLNRLSNISSSSAQALHPELSPSLQHPGRTARELGGNYGFFRRMGIDSRTRRDDSHGPTPAIYRVVLYPSSETLWTDLRHLNNVEGGGLWTDDEVLQMESRILVSVVPQYEQIC